MPFLGPNHRQCLLARFVTGRADRSSVGLGKFGLENSISLPATASNTSNQLVTARKILHECGPSRVSEGEKRTVTRRLFAMSSANLDWTAIDARH